MQGTGNIRYNYARDTEIPEKIRFSAEQLRKLGDFGDMEDSRLEELCDFLAEYSVMIYNVLKSNEKAGDRQNLEILRKGRKKGN